MTKEVFIDRIKSLSENDEQNHHLFDGIRLGIINQLVSVNAFKVLSIQADKLDSFQGYFVSTSCSIHLNQIYLLVRISLKNKVIGHKSFEGKITELNQLQNQVARFLINQFLGKSIHKIKTKESISPEAYQKYLLAEFNFKKSNPEAVKKAKALFEEVLALEPEFSYGHSGYAKVLFHELRYSQISPDVYEKASVCMEVAMNNDPENIEAYTTKAMFAMYLEKDLEKAGVYFENARALNRDFATLYREYIWYLAALGRYKEGLKLVDVALEYDPLSLDLICSKGDIYRYDKSFNKALLCYQEAFQMDSNYRRAITGLVVCYMYKNNEERSMHYLNLYMSKVKNPLGGYGSVGAVAAWFKNQELLDKAFSKLKERAEKEPNVDLDGDYLFIYCITDIDKAIEYLVRLYHSGGGLISILCDPILEGVRNTVEFKELTSGLNLRVKEAELEQSPDRIIHIQSELSESLTIKKVDLLYAEADGNYTHIYYKKGLNVTSMLMRIKISALEKQLELHGIQRIHKSYLVNLDNGNLNLQGNAHSSFVEDRNFEFKLPVSRNKYAELKLQIQ